MHGVEQEYVLGCKRISIFLCLETLHRNEARTQNATDHEYEAFRSWGDPQSNSPLAHKVTIAAAGVQGDLAVLADL